MTNNDETRDDFLRQFEEREPGVVDLLELYEHLEAIYVSATQASSETPSATTSNSTNRE